jgi:hypothetical protein
MSETLIIREPETGAERPVPVAPVPSNETVAPADKALKDTKAELTRVQQELAALKKGQAVPADPTPPPADEADPLAIPEDTGEAEGGDDEQVVPGIANEAFEPWREEYTKTGDVSPESRTAIVDLLKGKGFAPDLAKQLVDDYVESAKVRDKAAQAQADNAAKSLMDGVGGQEAYQNMVLWASKNFTEAERKAYDGAVKSGDVAAASLAISGLQARYKAANKGTPKMVQATGLSSPTSDNYASMYEVKTDMSKPEYRNDPAFRAKVQAKLARSNI